MKINNNLQGHLAILSANLIYGANFSIAKLVMPQYIKPFGFILLRVLGAAVLFWISGFFIKEKIHPTDFKRLFWCSFFGVALNQLMFFAGLNLTVPINASIIMITTPVLVLIISHFILKEPFKLTNIIGILLGITGASILIIGSKKAAWGGGNPLGDFFILINATSFAIYLVIAKPLIQKYHVITLSKWIFLIGLVLVLPFGFNELKAINWHTFTPQLYAATTFVVVGVTYFAYLGNNFGLKKLNPNAVSYYIYLQPLFASIIAILLKLDAITSIKILAAIIIFTGIYLINKKIKT